MSKKQKILVYTLLLVVILAIYMTGIAFNWYGESESAGEIRALAIPDSVLSERERVQGLVSEPGAKQILFGDLHVHTTFSSDAFRMSLPMVQGDGAHPPADACDFARVCAALDFWALTDHAESLTRDRWLESMESVQQCNAVSGNPQNPDLVTFVGFEWTQAGGTVDTHYGHKNVIFREDDPARLPTRAIGSPFRAAFSSTPLRLRLLPPLRDFSRRQRYYDFNQLIQDIGDQPLCPDSGHVSDLPLNCAETAQTPDVLFRKLDEWGFDSMVVPHGNAWGVYSPAGTSWDKQLGGSMHDPERQTLIEVFSGHGSSEVHRDWRAVEFDEDGGMICPPPRPDYLPSCWRAGEIIRNRCLESGAADSSECDRRAAAARQHYLQYGQLGWHTVPGATLEDWLDAGQCRDCFAPAFNYRPGGSAQYALAIGNFEQEGPPKRFRFGFVASSDNHTARPGTGYKQYARRPMVDWWGYHDSDSRSLYSTDRGTPEPFSVEVDPGKLDVFNILELERQASFFLTGGLVAAHAEGRDRDAIWSALLRKEVYGTSGPRILLWFDLLDRGGNSRVFPMGSELELAENPKFRARAVGALTQNPGCPPHSEVALGHERLERLCRGECYNPADQRLAIDRIEVIRIRPQEVKGEPVAPLIEDPWRTFDCDVGQNNGCSVEFEDPDFISSGRDAVYYVRALQVEEPIINAGGLRCAYDEWGQCIEVKPCYGDDRTDSGDQCLSTASHRAWSSPIFIDQDSQFVSNDQDDETGHH